MDRIVSVASLTIDLDRVRAININSFRGLGKTNVLTVEYNGRIEYSKNPFTDEIEKDMIIDTITKEFPDFEMAQLYHLELMECWKEYLDSKKK